MANISRDTFDKLKHYVGVRLQQGVPIIDADWNEMEDIRRFELRSFIKWFVGDGIPKGNDGFKIVPILSIGPKVPVVEGPVVEGPVVGPTESQVETPVLPFRITTKDKNIDLSADIIDSEKSTALNALRIKPDIDPASLTFKLKEGMTLILSAEGFPGAKVVFKKSDFKNIQKATFEEVTYVLDRDLKKGVFRIPPPQNNFFIKGGNEAGPGHCLVDGWDVNNKTSIDFQWQRLYNNDDLAQEWGVEPLEPLSPPTSGERTDIVYLDVWEREVDSEEDVNLVNPAIGIETCVRRRREWVVRVKEGQSGTPDPQDGHAFYPLATIKREANKNSIGQDDITDLRRTGMAVLSEAITITDGNVGIGTTQPGGHLDIKNGHGDWIVLSQKRSANDGGGFHIHNPWRDTDDDKRNCLHIAYRPHNAGTKWGQFVINGPTGNVGIGTSRPDAQLSLGKLDSDGAGPTGDGATQLLLSGKINTGVNLGSTNGTYKLRIEGYNNDDELTVYPIYCIDENNMVDFWIKNRPGPSGLPTMFFAGNVGIGTNDPQTKLHIVGGSDVTLSGGGLLVIGSTSASNIAIDNNEIMARNNNGTNPLHLQTNGGDLYIHNNCPEEDKNKVVVKDDGKVGIGTTEPKDKLDVHGTLRFNGNNEMKVSGEIRNEKNAVAIRGHWDELEVKGRVIDWTGSNLHIGFDNDHSGDYIEIGRKVGHIRFLSGGGNSETMRITDGKVGIGTTHPTLKFHVKTASAVGLFESTTNTAYLRLNTNEGDDNRVEFCNRSGGRAAIWVASGVDAFNVLRDGKVGIGTTEPGEKLEVLDGSAKFVTSTGQHPLIISRMHGGSTEQGTQELRIGVEDSVTTLHYINDEKENRLDFRMENEDTETGDGTNANDNIVMSIMGNKAGGNVGIGTTSPGTHLDVRHGTLRVSGKSGWNQEEARLVIDPGASYGHRFFLCKNIEGKKFKIDGNGHAHAVEHKTGGLDYAEYFESKNGKVIKVGTSVVVDNGKIRAAKKNEIPMGAISKNPGITGGLPLEWPKKYLRDEFGSQIMEEYKEEIMAPKKEKIKKERQKIKKKTVKEKITRTEIACEDGKYFQKEVTETVEKEVEEPVFKEVDLYDAKKENIIGKHRIPVMETYEEEIDVKDDKGEPVMIGTGKFETKTRPKINPDYDETKEYIPREKRPEWNCVGLLGQLPLRKGQPTADTWVKIKDISKDVELWLVK